MSMREALRRRLVESPAVAAIVADRVFWDERPQASALPAIVLQVVSDPRPQTMKGFQAARATRVQADCMAQTGPAGGGPAIVAALVEAVIAAVAPAAQVGGTAFSRSFVDAARDLPERTEHGIVNRTSLDLIVWHATA